MSKSKGKGKVDISTLLIGKVGVAGGALLGAGANKISFISDLPAWARGGVKAGVGALLPVGVQMFMPDLAKGNAGMLINGIADGMLAIGTVELANATVFKSNPVSIAGANFATLGAYSVQDAQVAGSNFATLGAYSVQTGDELID